MKAKEPPEWRPTARLEYLKLRAKILAEVRVFFADLGVMEVETPVMGESTLPHPSTFTFATRYESEIAPKPRILYLQTSPESAMKRLLAWGSGPIYQICKAFRNREEGNCHNPEFTILEWYRPGFDHFKLMDEVDCFLQKILGSPPGERLSYKELFQAHLNIDPHTISTDHLMQCVTETTQVGRNKLEGGNSRDYLLDLLMKNAIEPHLGFTQPVFVYHYPASQSCYARIAVGDPPVAERFETYFKGIELANGYHELIDREDQEQRFLKEQKQRHVLGRERVPTDERLLSALAAGLPDCAGVAIGFDRLVMLAAGTDSLSDVITFTVDRA